VAAVTSPSKDLLKLRAVLLQKPMVQSPHSMELEVTEVSKLLVMPSQWKVLWILPVTKI
jgi:hypothetical protein